MLASQTDFCTDNDNVALDAFLASASNISQSLNNLNSSKDHHTESATSLPSTIFTPTFNSQITKPIHLVQSNEVNLICSKFITAAIIAQDPVISPSFSVATADTPSSMFSVNNNGSSNNPTTTSNTPAAAITTTGNSNYFNGVEFDGNINGNNGVNEHGEVELPSLDPQRDSSEEKDLTPAQARRKAQNRAAQRAFRERKEKHVKELENRLNRLESTTHNLRTDNERLKLAVQRATTENEILRATSGSAGSGIGIGIGDLEPRDSDYGSGNGSDSDVPEVDGGGAVSGRRQKAAAARAKAKHAGHDLYSTGSCIGGGHNNLSSPSGATSSHHLAFSNSSSSSTLLPSSAAWDFIQAHPLFKAGQLDIADVTDRLRRVVQCDGHGPGFEKADIKRAIEQSRISSSDELI